MGSKSVRLILWAPWISVSNSMAVLVETFHLKTKMSTYGDIRGKVMGSPQSHYSSTTDKMS